MIKNVIGRVALYGLAPQVSKVASFFVLPIITRDLTSVDYGVAGIVTAYTAAFGVFQTLGLNVVLSNSFYKSPNFYKWQWRQIHGFLSIWSLVFAAFLAAILYHTIPESAVENRLAIILLNCLPIAFFGTSQNITFRFYHLSQKAKALAVRTASIGLVSVLINLYTISYLKLGYMGWFISSATSTAISFLAFSYPIYFKYKLTPIFNFKRKSIKKDLHISLPTVPHYYASYLLNLSDRVVMDMANVSVINIGLYNLAYTFGNYYSSLVDAISLAVSPTYLKLYKQNTDLALLALKKMTFLLQAGLFIVSFLMCIWMKEVFQLLIKNPALHQAYPIAIIIVLSYNYRPMYLAAINKIFFMEKTKILWRVSFVAGVINVISNVIFIPLYGIKAAAVITFISYLYMGYSGYFFKEYRETSKIKLYPIFWLIISILLLPITLLIVNTLLMIKIIITVLVIAGVGLLYLKYKPAFNTQL